jgi:hypothetical protein
VREIEVVAAIDAAGHDDPDRRLVRLHVANLHGGGVGAEQGAAIVGPAAIALNRPGEVEGVLHVARRVLGRHVQRVEAVPLVLDLRPLDDGEAHAREDLLHPVAHDGQRMPVAEPRPASWKRHVDAAGRCGVCGLFGTFHRASTATQASVGMLADLLLLLDHADHLIRRRHAVLTTKARSRAAASLTDDAAASRARRGDERLDGCGLGWSRT